MFEIVKPQGTPAVLRAQSPLPPSESLATVRVDWVALCRTDLLVADASLPSFDGIVLGHEFSGTVLHDPSGRFVPGSPVAGNPLLPGRKFMGLHADGALRSLLQIAPSQLVDAHGVDPMLAAYVEPVAASMAPAKARISKTDRGAIYHANRISELTYRIMRSMGYAVEWRERAPDGTETEIYDYAIETSFEDIHVSRMLRALKPGGLLVVKSRQGAPRSIVPAELVAKELTLQAVNYHDFDLAMDWIRRNPAELSSLIGQAYDLRDWQDAFAAARSGEAKKIFIRMGA